MVGRAHGRDDRPRRGVLIDGPAHPSLPVGDKLQDWVKARDRVWRASWTPTGAPVVVKWWPVPAGVSGPARLATRKRAVAALGTSTPEVFWCELVDGHIVSVVRWEEGAAPPTPLSPSSSTFLGWLHAVGRLHEAGLVHRDICPRNTLVTPDGRVLLLDLDEVLETGVDADVVGSPGFIAPEVAAGGAATAASDLFALARALDPQQAPVVVALTSAPRPECRAADGHEVRAALPLPEHAPAYTGVVHGPEALHDIPARAAALRSTPDGQRVLDRLCAAGVGHAEDDGSRRLHPTDFHRWQALLDPDCTVATNLRRVERGAPGLAVWSLLRTVPRGSAPALDWLDALGAAALHTHDPRALRRVRAELSLLPDAGGATSWWTTLLWAALAVYAGGAAEALRVVEALAVPDRMQARRAREVVLFRVALGVGVARAQAVLDDVSCTPPADDPDAEARWLAWKGLLAYRSGDVSAATACLSQAWPRRVFAHEAALAASNLVAVWLHGDDPLQGEAVARQALQRLPAGAHPFAAARLAAKLREAVYRGHIRPAPDPATLDAIRVAGPPFAVALATLNEAAAAWRFGAVELARNLAHDAAQRFDRAGMFTGRTLAGALAHRLEHPAWVHATDRLEAAVDDMVDESRGIWLPALAAQVLGLLATGPDDPLAEDARELAEDSGLPLETRREVLSLAEAGRGALLA